MLALPKTTQLAFGQNCVSFFTKLAKGELIKV